MVKRGNSNWFNIIFILVIITYLIQSVFSILGLVKHNDPLIGNLFICVIGFLALASSWMLYIKFPDKFILEKKGRLFLVSAFLLFFLGDIYWALEEILFNNLMPIGGFADLFWNLAYLSLGTSLVFFIKSNLIESYKRIFLLIFFGILGGLIFLYFDITEDLAEGTFYFSHFIQDLYPFYDLILLSLIVVLIWPLIKSSNKLIYSWIILGIGVIARVVYDFIFIFMSENETYYSGHPIDLIYVLLYISIIISNLLKNNVLGIRK